MEDLSASLDDVLAEATVFIASCYGSKERNDLSKVRVDLWSKKMGKKIPPTALTTQQFYKLHILREVVRNKAPGNITKIDELEK